MEQGFSITLIIVIVTAIISLVAFSNQKLMGDLIFDPTRISGQKQYYRFLSSGFIHADYFHLGFNMLALYSFGEALEKYLLTEPCTFGSKGTFIYVFIYLTGIIFAHFPSYNKNKNNPYYLSLGASGGVSAILFVTIAMAPQVGISFFFLPQIPGYIFGVIYLAASAYMDKRGTDNVNHSAHIWGAVYGLFALAVFAYTMGNFDVIANFKQQVRMPMNVLHVIECK